MQTCFKAMARMQAPLRSMAIAQASDPQILLSLISAPQLQEADVLTTLETMCDPDTDAGDWVTRYDIVEDTQGEALKLHDTGKVSHMSFRVSPHSSKGLLALKP